MFGFLKRPSGSDKAPAQAPIQPPVQTPDPSMQEPPLVVKRGPDNPEDVVWSDEEIKATRLRSQRRLIGAIFLVLVAIIVLPLVLNTKREQVVVSVQSPGQPNVSVLAQNMQSDQPASTGFTPTTPRTASSTVLAPSPTPAPAESANKPVPESVAQKTARLNNTASGSDSGKAHKESSKPKTEAPKTAKPATSKPVPDNYNSIGEPVYATPQNPSYNKSSTAKAIKYNYRVAFARVTTKQAAENTLARLTLNGVGPAQIQSLRYKGRTYYRVVVGSFKTQTEARRLQQKARRWQLPSSIIIKVKE